MDIILVLYWLIIHKLAIVCGVFVVEDSFLVNTLQALFLN